MLGIYLLLVGIAILEIVVLWQINQSKTGKVEIIMSYIVADDHAPVGYSITVGEAKDAEGNVVPDAQLGITVESDQPDVVKVTQNDDPKTGSISFGNPGNATITVNVFSGEALLGSGSASFVVTAGDPASISGVTLGFDNLTEASAA